MKYRSKFIYLISPNRIYPSFYNELKSVLKTNKVNYFQLRLKKNTENQIKFFSKKIKKICKTYKVKFIINDNPLIAKKVNADGCHLGQKDMSLKNARKIINKKIVGITCHNSIRLAKKACKDKADYIAIGAFYQSKTKKSKFKATINDLKKFRKLSNTKIVAIGGINETNYKKLLLNKADFLAISGFIWNNKNLKPDEAISKLK